MKFIVMLIAIVLLSGCYNREFKTQYLIEPLAETESKNFELASHSQEENDAIIKIITVAISECKGIKFIDVCKVVNNPDLLVYYYGEQWEISAMAFRDKSNIYVNVECIFGPFGSHPAYDFLKDKIYQDLKKHFGERIVFDINFSKSNAFQKVFYNKLWDHNRKNHWRTTDWSQLSNFVEQNKVTKN